MYVTGVHIRLVMLVGGFEAGRLSQCMYPGLYKRVRANRGGTIGSPTGKEILMELNEVVGVVKRV